MLAKARLSRAVLAKVCNVHTTRSFKGGSGLPLSCQTSPPEMLHLKVVPSFNFFHNASQMICPVGAVFQYPHFQQVFHVSPLPTLPCFLCNIPVSLFHSKRFVSNFVIYQYDFCMEFCLHASLLQYRSEGLTPNGSFSPWV